VSARLELIDTIGFRSGSQQGEIVPPINWTFDTQLCKISTFLLSLKRKGGRGRGRGRGTYLAVVVISWQSTWEQCHGLEIYALCSTQRLLAWLCHVKKRETPILNDGLARSVNCKMLLK
jgi:hypothetical protein